jgi:hypothetical protein
MFLDVDVLTSIHESDERDYSTQFQLNKQYIFNAYSWLDVLQSVNSFCFRQEDLLPGSTVINILNKARFNHVDTVDVKAEWDDIAKVSSWVKENGFIGLLDDPEINLFSLMNQSVAIDDRIIDRFVDKFEPVIVGSTATRRVWPTMNFSAHMQMLMRVIHKRMQLEGEYKATADTYAYAALRIALPSIIHLRSGDLHHLPDHHKFSENYMSESVLDFISQMGLENSACISQELIERAFLRLPKEFVNVDAQLVVGISLSLEQRERASPDQLRKSLSIDFGI